MTEWWQSLSDPSRIFWSIAITASVFQLLLFVGSMLVGHDLDHSPDGGDGGGSEHGLKLLSVRAITAFLVGFGWAGALILGSGKTLLIASVFALVCGMIFMAVIYLMMRFITSLKSDGTIRYPNAIGHTGHVYVTIPAARGGRGQVEILIQGRLITAQAVTSHPQPLPPQSSVIVDSVEGDTLLVVSPQA